LITTRHMTIEAEIVRWMLLAAAALALILAIATALASGDSTREPRLLPQNIRDFAKPMPAEIQPPFFPEEPPIRKLPPAEAGARLWVILDNYRAGRFGEALAEWNYVRLPEDTAHWREIAMGVAYLQVGNHPRAADHFGMARQLAPDDAIVAYSTGMLRWEQAKAAGRIPDTTDKTQYFVAYTPAEDRDLYQTLAIAEFRFAIARAEDIRLDVPLVAAERQSDEEFIAPTARDLLVALGADNFVGKAHQALFALQLSRGELMDAEFHIRQAAAHGVATLAMYQELTEVYLDQGHGADAIRVGTNGLRAACPWIDALCQRLNAVTLTPARPVWVW
jgi:hypothetical protein